MECWRRKTLLEKKSCATVVLLLIGIIALISLILLVTEPQFCSFEACIEAFQRLNALIDPQRDPCDNFSHYVCGKKLSFPKDDTERVLMQIVSEPERVKDTQSLKLQKQFYRSCVDLKAIDFDNDTTFLSLVEKLGGWPVVSGNNWNESAFDFAEFMVNLKDLGFRYDWFLDISIRTNFGEDIVLEINVPKNTVKFDRSEEKLYIELMTDVALAFGAHRRIAEFQMPEVIHLEKRLANLVEEIHAENREKSLHLVTLMEVQKKWQKLNWLEFLNHLTKKKLSDNQLVAFYVESYMKKLDKLLKETTKRTQVNYIIWKLIETFTPYLSKKIRDLMSNYFIKKNTQEWYQDRNIFCLQESKSFFQYTLEAEYVRRYVTQTKKRKVEEIIERILAKLEKHIRDSSRLQYNIRKSIIYKIQNISYIIRGPEEMYYATQFDKDFGIGNLEINSSNIIHISTKLFEQRPTERHKDVNYLKYTFYELVLSKTVKFMPRFNLLWVPAGTLHGFLYDDGRPNYLNYGTLGTTIAQELVQAVYSKNMTKNVTFCLSHCNDGLDVEIDCEDNFSHVMSSYIGVDVAYEAYKNWEKQKGTEKKLHGFNINNDRLFWLAYGTSMCHLNVPELNYSRFDHMIQSFKIVGPLRNSLYFGRDFECELGSTMNPSDKCQIL